MLAVKEESASSLSWDEVEKPTSSTKINHSTSVELLKYFKELPAMTALLKNKHLDKYIDFLTIE